MIEFVLRAEQVNEGEPDGYVEFQFRAERLPEVVEQVERFLRAAGYEFPTGVHLGYEEDEA